MRQYDGMMQCDWPFLVGVRNVPFGQASAAVGPKEPPDGIEAAIELLEPQKAPQIKEPFVLNFDYADPASSRRRSMPSAEREVNSDDACQR
jgi:hypothetical protein